MPRDDAPDCASRPHLGWPRGDCMAGRSDVESANRAHLVQDGNFTPARLTAKAPPLAKRGQSSVTAFTIQRHQCPHRVRNGPSAAPSGKSALGGEADAINAKADIDTRRSAVGGRADVLATWPESPFIAINGPKDGWQKSEIFPRACGTRRPVVQRREPGEARASARLGLYVRRWVRWAGAA